jgi:sensory rhodopsin
MIGSAVWFGIAAGVFFLTAFGYVAFASVRGKITSPYYFLPPVHATIAGIAYVGMTLVAADLLPELIQLEFIRYLDWTLSTPIITYYLAMLADVDIETRVIAVLANVVMIVVGFGAAVTPSPFKWAFFAFSSILFVGLMYIYVKTFSDAIEQNPRSSRSVFLSLRDLTIIIWGVYPVAFLLGPSGTGLLLPTDHNFLIALLDLTAKVGFMIILLVRQYELNTFLAAETTASPSTSSD